MALSSADALVNAALNQAEAGRADGSPATGRAYTETEAERAAQDFEAHFLTQVVSTLFEGLETPGRFSAGPGEGPFKSFLYQEYGQALARSGGIGIAETVKAQLLAFQERV
ncbi:MAG: rod-binding protein [Maricaulaceae bacterium]